MTEVRFGGRTRLFAAVLAGAVALAGCSEDPIVPEHEEDAEGVQIVLNGVVVAEYADGAWTGELEVTEGEETAHIDVVFVDHDGEEVALDDDVYLEVDIEDETVAEWEQDTPGEFGGHLHGIAEGETEAVFKLMHGAVGSGHADFETTGVPVRVNAAG